MRELNHISLYLNPTNTKLHPPSTRLRLTSNPSHTLHTINPQISLFSTSTSVKPVTMTETSEEQTLNKSRTPSTMELESQQATSMTKKPLYRRPCCGITVAVILLLVIVLIILIFTVFKIKDPTITIVSTRVTGVSPRVTFPVIQIQLNITLNLNISVHNPNYASFRAGNGSSEVYYAGAQVAEVATDTGNVRARRTSFLTASLTVQADKVDMGSLARDVMAGQMRMEVQTRVPGKAKLLGFITKHVVSLSNCEIDIKLPSLEVLSQECKNKAKL